MSKIKYQNSTGKYCFAKTIYSNKLWQGVCVCVFVRACTNVFKALLE